MKRKLLHLAVVVGASAVCTSAFAVDLTGGDYYYDIPNQPGDTTTIAFTYNSGGNPLKIDFLGLTDPGNPVFDDQAGWMMPFRDDGDHGTQAYFDSDYGPYTIGDIDESVAHNYVFNLNEANGMVTLSIDGTSVGLTTVAGDSNSPQPDGGYTNGAVNETLTHGFFSDETQTSADNAAALGWTANASDGVGGIGAYRLRFFQAQGGSVEVPEPASLALMGLASIVGLGYRRRRA